MVGLVNLPSNGYIWILVATEYFTKWVKAILLRKATRGAVANFIKDNVIACFLVPYKIISDNVVPYKIISDNVIPYKIISDNGTPLVNKEVRKMLEFYQVKHHQSSPYYPQGNRQAEPTNKTLIKLSTK